MWSLNEHSPWQYKWRIHVSRQTERMQFACGNRNQQRIWYKRRNKLAHFFGNLSTGISSWRSICDLFKSWVWRFVWNIGRKTRERVRDFSTFYDRKIFYCKCSESMSSCRMYLVVGRVRNIIEKLLAVNTLKGSKIKNKSAGILCYMSQGRRSEAETALSLRNV